MHSRTVPLLGVGLLLALGLSYACAGTFPDAHDEPPEGWTGPVFKLRQNYPKNPPPVEAYPWKKFDFKKQPLDYLRSVLKSSAASSRSSH